MIPIPHPLARPVATTTTPARPSRLRYPAATNPGRLARHLAATAATALLAWLPGMLRAQTDAPAPPRPNFIFVVIDDLRWDAPGFMGNTLVQTPHLDALAAGGVVFEKSFVTTSICAVSRASFFTGQWMTRHGITDFATGLSETQWADSYPVRLRDTGYRTGFVGKFGVGAAGAIKAAEGYFDFWRGEPGQGSPDFIDPADPTRTHQTARLGSHALEFVASAVADRPFCLSISFTAVHARDGRPREFQPDDRDESLYADTEFPTPRTATDEAFRRLPEAVRRSEGRTRWQRRFATPEMAQSIVRDYFRLLTGVDREIGRLREALAARGLADRTVIVVTGDNGFALGDRGLADKWFMWEEDIRVPTLIFDPRLAQAQRGRRVPALTLNVDFAPTLLDLAGAAVPAGMQGRSLSPWLRGETPADWRREFYYEHVTLPQLIPPCEGVRTENWKFIRWTAGAPGSEELYDLDADPFEEHNLAGDVAHAATVETLRAATDRHRRDLR
jgi:arylsulfatase A-like enzyme